MVTIARYLRLSHHCDVRERFCTSGGTSCQQIVGVALRPTPNIHIAIDAASVSMSEDNAKDRPKLLLEPIEV